jgi:hypothetical protein
MKKIWLPALLYPTLFSFIGCKQKKNENFPVLSFIKSQVAHVDSSLYSIRKIIYSDSTKTDTFYYKREQFRELASDFLNIPDIAESKYKDRFTEEKQFDETLNRVIIHYQPKNPEKEIIQRQEILIRPDPPDDKITSIIIDYLISNKDSIVQKRMLWQVDKSFQVTTIRQLPGQQETNSIYKVIWNEEDDK